MLGAVSFSCKAGQTLALVGATGSGKSTIVRMLYRLYDPTSGRVLLDGQDLTSLHQKSFRNHLGMVPQVRARKLQMCWLQHLL